MPARTRHSRSFVVGQCAAAAVVLALTAIAPSGRAFASGPLTKTGLDLRVPLGSAAPALSAAPLQARPAGSSSWQSFSSVALLGACAVAAARAMQPVKKQTRSIRVTTQALPVLHAPQPQAQAARTIEPMAPTVHSLVDLDAPVTVSAPALPRAQPPVVLAPAAPQVAQQSAEPKKDVFSGVSTPRGQPARFVAGARVSANRGSQSSRASRSARRGVGARLLPACEHQVITPSFDSSRVRISIQLGLRMNSHVHSESAREVKTPACSDGITVAAKMHNLYLLHQMQRLHQNQPQVNQLTMSWDAARRSSASHHLAMCGDGRCGERRLWRGSGVSGGGRRGGRHPAGQGVRAVAGNLPR
jgi:hypothetical protein